jgi:surface-anchored protein
MMNQYTPGWRIGAATAVVSVFCLHAQVVELSEGHVDVRAVYAPGTDEELGLRIRDGESGRVYLSDEVALVVSEVARLDLPPGTPFGPEASWLWVLPQGPEPGLLYLGVSAQGIAAGVFEGPLELRLLAVEAVGEFFLWQAEVGGLSVRMNSADGVDEADSTSVAAGGHEHLNWGFSSNGVHRLTFQLFGRRDGVELSSLPTVVEFRVLPLPEEPESPFEAWQQRHWPAGTSELVTAPGADPDGDGVVNLLEYVLGLDPNIASREGLPKGVISEGPGEPRFGLRYTRAKEASDVGCGVVGAGGLEGEVWMPVVGEEEVIDLGAVEQVTVWRKGVDGVENQFYMKLEVRFP